MSDQHRQSDAEEQRGAGPASSWPGAGAAVIAYFVQDVSDPAVRRRVEMLTAGGARVEVAGFRRRAEPVRELLGARVFDLGRTYDARLLHRAVKTLFSPLAALPLGPRVRGASAVMARNLEMLFLVKIARPVWRARAPVYYEVLDIHRVMLREDGLGRFMRGIEKRLMRGIAGVVVSSPAFERNYFSALQNITAPILLVENKTPDGWGSAKGRAASSQRRDETTLEAPPWRIAWFGKIRCQKSLDILDRVTRALEGRLLVDLRGQPSYTVFRDFDAQVGSNPALRFHGPYAPSELPDLYAACHFVWGIDYYEENQNSDWLLPNRLYEGGAARLPILALARVETGRWLAAHGAGVLIKDPEAELEPFFTALTGEGYGALHAAAKRIPHEALSAGVEECRALVERLCG